MLVLLKFSWLDPASFSTGQKGGGVPLQHLKRLRWGSWGLWRRKQCGAGTVGKMRTGKDCVKNLAGSNRASDTLKYCNLSLPPICFLNISRVVNYVLLNYVLQVIHLNLSNRVRFLSLLNFMGLEGRISV